MFQRWDKLDLKRPLKRTFFHVYEEEKRLHGKYVSHTMSQKAALLHIHIFTGKDIT